MNTGGKLTINGNIRCKRYNNPYISDDTGLRQFLKNAVLKAVFMMSASLNVLQFFLYSCFTQNEQKDFCLTWFIGFKYHS